MLIPKNKPVRGTPAAKAHMAAVAELPCVVCASWPVQVHHCIHGRFSQSRASDFDTIPLCPRCHDDLHHHPHAWKRQHGEDRDFIPRVADALRHRKEMTL